MKPLRKVLGLLVIILLGVPLLFAVIWTVGVTRAAVSPDFASKLPQEIISSVPDVIDEIIEDGQKADVIQNANTRAWFQAMAKAGQTPRELMAEIGVLDWMENELTGALKAVGEALRGERTVRSVKIDLRPLKNALLRPEVEGYILDVLKNLPPCDEAGYQRWRRLAEEGIGRQEIPACQPDVLLAREVIRYKEAQVVGDIDNEVQIFEGGDWFRFGISKTVNVLSYALFLIPALFLFGGALIAATSPAGFLRWSGIPILVGGLMALLLAWLVRYFGLLAMRLYPFHSPSAAWSSDLQDLLLTKTKWIVYAVIDQLFSPVIAVAGIVCVVGVVLIGLSFLSRSR